MNQLSAPGPSGLSVSGTLSLSTRTRTKRRVGVKHFITLRSELSRVNRSSYSWEKNEPTVLRVSQRALSREFSCKEILSMTWKLSLRCQDAGNRCFSSGDKQVYTGIKLIPRIEMVPDLDVKEKLGDVWINSRKSLFVNGSSVPIKIMTETCCAKGSLLAVPCEDTIVLKKEERYKCDLTYKDSPIVILSGDTIGIAVKSIVFEMEIYPIKHTFGIIDPVAIPPCPMLQDLRSMLAFNEEESKQKFCDVTITCPATKSCEKDENHEVELLEDDEEIEGEEEKDDEEMQGEEEKEEENEEEVEEQTPSPPQKRQQSQDGEAEEKVTFYAHKAILAARSQYFARMFSADMKESATNTVDLVDIKPDVLAELLTYIYSGECPNIKTHAASLLYQAEIYDLSHLKALCEERLSYDIQVDNAARTLLLADAWNAEQLKWNSLLFINEHGDEVRDTEEWEEVTESRELLKDLFNAKYDREPPAKKPKLV